MRPYKIRPRYNTTEDAIRDIGNIVNSEPTFSLTLTTGTASTSISNPLCGKDSFIDFMPTTANAASDMNSMYVSARNLGSFTITHVNNANNDRTFIYTITG